MDEYGERDASDLGPRRVSAAFGTVVTMGTAMIAYPTPIPWPPEGLPPEAMAWALAYHREAVSASRELDDLRGRLDSLAWELRLERRNRRLRRHEAGRMIHAALGDRWHR